MSQSTVIFTQAVIPIIVWHKSPQSENVESVLAYVNYGHEEVYLPNNPELDNEAFKNQILNSLDASQHIPPEVEIPINLTEELAKIKEQQAKIWEKGRY